MYIVLLTGVLSLWYIGCSKNIKLTALIGQGNGQKEICKDKGEHLADFLQTMVVIIVSGMNALRISSTIEAVLVFFVTFIVCTWFIKIMVAGITWLQIYSKMLTFNGAFAICTPLIILWHMPKMCSALEIRLTFLALLLSTLIVYGEIIHIVIGKAVLMSKAIQIKSILTWLVIILMNLYTLLVFVQFYMNVKAHHFIAAEHITKQAMVDLLYYLIVTFTTVGFGDIRPGTSLAKIITCMIALSGMLFTGVFMGAVLGTDKFNEK